MKINPDSPAFPIPPDFVSANGELCQVRDFGLTVRAYIAVEAMKSLILKAPGGIQGDLVCKEAAKFADCMIAELNKQP